MACSLSATELPRRLLEIANVGRAALLAARTGGTSAELRFAAGSGVRQRVEAIVAAESECCAFLAMRVDDEPDVVVLTIAACQGAELVLADFVDAFRSQPQGGR